jgi:hypothetical protein
MDWLEQELKSALARKEPSPGFSARVSTAARRPRIVAWPRWMAAAAAVILIAGGAAGYRQYQGMVAKEKVMLAMRIASGKLNRIQEQVMQVSR